MSLDIAAGRLCVNKNEKQENFVTQLIKDIIFLINTQSCFGVSFACDKEKWHCSDIHDCLQLCSDIAEIVTRKGNI